MKSSSLSMTSLLWLLWDWLNGNTFASTCSIWSCIASRALFLVMLFDGGDDLYGGNRWTALRRSAVCSDSSRLRLSISINPETNFLQGLVLSGPADAQWNSASASLRSRHGLPLLSVCPVSFSTARYPLGRPLGSQRRDMRFDELAHLENVRQRSFFFDQHFASGATRDSTGRSTTKLPMPVRLTMSP